MSAAGVLENSRARRGKVTPENPMKRLLTRLTSYQLKTREELDTEFNKAFDGAKRVSDVGMIVRLAFCAYATQFFWSQAKTSVASSHGHWASAASRHFACRSGSGHRSFC
jgi:hypothetical protein